MYLDSRRISEVTMAVAALITAAVLLLSPVHCRPTEDFVDTDSSGHGSGSGREKREMVTSVDVIMDGFAYYKKLQLNSECRLPQPRLIPLQHLHPSNEVVYVTQCVYLHRCAYDTGCCPSSKVCAPTTQGQEEIEIPILMTTNGESLQGGPVYAKIMKFTNHTTCECLDKP